MKPDSTSQPPPLGHRIWSQWTRVADWLGARRPLDLVCGMMIVILSISGAIDILFGA